MIKKFLVFPNGVWLEKWRNREYSLYKFTFMSLIDKIYIQINKNKNKKSPKVYREGQKKAIKKIKEIKKRKMTKKLKKEIYKINKKRKERKKRNS